MLSGSIQETSGIDAFVVVSVSRGAGTSSADLAWTFDVWDVKKSLMFDFFFLPSYLDICVYLFLNKVHIFDDRT